MTTSRQDGDSSHPDSHCGNSHKKNRPRHYRRLSRDKNDRKALRLPQPFQHETHRKLRPANPLHAIHWPTVLLVLSTI